MQSENGEMIELTRELFERGTVPHVREIVIRNGLLKCKIRTLTIQQSIDFVSRQDEARDELDKFEIMVSVCCETLCDENGELLLGDSEESRAALKARFTMRDLMKIFEEAVGVEMGKGEAGRSGETGD
jgi:hypothetical protein